MTTRRKWSKKRAKPLTEWTHKEVRQELARVRHKLVMSQIALVGTRAELKEANGTIERLRDGAGKASTILDQALFPNAKRREVGLTKE